MYGHFCCTAVHGPPIQRCTMLRGLPSALSFCRSRECVGGAQGGVRPAGVRLPCLQGADVGRGGRCVVPGPLACPMQACGPTSASAGRVCTVQPWCAETHCDRSSLLPYTQTTYALHCRLGLLCVASSALAPGVDIARRAGQTCRRRGPTTCTACARRSRSRPT